MAFIKQPAIFYTMLFPMLSVRGVYIVLLSSPPTDESHPIVELMNNQQLITSGFMKVIWSQYVCKKCVVKGIKSAVCEHQKYMVPHFLISIGSDDIYTCMETFKRGSAMVEMGGCVGEGVRNVHLFSADKARQFCTHRECIIDEINKLFDHEVKDIEVLIGLDPTHDADNQQSGIGAVGIIKIKSVFYVSVHIRICKTITTSTFYFNIAIFL